MILPQDETKSKPFQPDDAKKSGGGDSQPQHLPEHYGTKLEDLMIQSGDEDKWVLDPYIQRGEKVMLTSVAKCGKTTWVANVMRGMKNGGHLIGKIHKGTVVILSEERKAEWIDRTKKLDLSGYVSIYLREDVWNLSWPEICCRLGQEAKRVDASLVIVDSFLKFNGVQDENDAPQMQRAVDALDLITENCDAAVLVLHHSRKRGGRDGTEIRGSGAIAGAFDVLMNLQYYGKSSSDNRRELYSVGRRDDLRLREIITLVDGLYEGAVPESAAAAKHRVIYGILAKANEPMTRDEILESWPSDPPPGKTQLKSALEEGVTAGSWTATDGKRGKPSRYTVGPNPLRGWEPPDRIENQPRSEPKNEENKVGHPRSLRDGVPDRIDADLSDGGPGNGRASEIPSDRTDRKATHKKSPRGGSGVSP